MRYRPRTAPGARELLKPDRLPPPPLLAAYLERRSSLVRFFMARTGSPEAAEDLAQELFLKVTAAGEGEEVRAPGAYLYRLAQNLLLDRLRQQRRSRVRDNAWYQDGRVVIGNEDVADLPDPEMSFTAKQRLAKVQAALRELPARTREVFQLHKFGGLTHAEVAHRLGISRSAVEKHVSAALKHLLARVGGERAP